MKRAPVSALIRPLVLFGVVVASACNAPAAPDSSTSAAGRASLDIAGGVPHLKSALSPEGRARALQEGRTKHRPVKMGHDIFGAKYDETYSGGQVISNVNIVMVHWGDVSTPSNVVNPSLAADLPGFYAAVITGPYFSWLAEYNTTNPINPLEDPFGVTGTGQTIGFGTVDTGGSDTGGAYLITPTINTTKSLDDGFGGGDIGSELVYQIGAGFLPAPVYDSLGFCNSLYVFDFPPGFNLDADGGSFCSSLCAVHGSVPYGSGFKYLPYTMHPDLGSCSGCLGKTSYLDTEQFYHSHEMIEAVTDAAQPLAWYDLSVSDGEIADLCASEAGVTVSGYYVTQGWSNANGQCIGVAPLCAPGTPSPPSCTPCNSTGAASCAAPTPVCDMTSGLCQGCLTNTDCSNPTPICDATTLTCRACTAGDCKGATPVCGTSGFDVGFCVECDSTDSSACKGATPVCAAYPDFKCVGCVFNSDCSGGTPICDATSQTCRACMSNSDCSPGFCDTGTGTCVGCLKSSDCGSETCNVSTHTCQCSGNSECKNPKPVCGSGKTCEGCKSSSDCAGNPAGTACSAGSCVECATSADCSAPTPVCDKKTNKCVAGGGTDAGTDSGRPPPGDSGVKNDGGGDGGGTTTGSSGGCSAAPSRADGGPGSGSMLLLAGLAVLGAHRRRRDLRA